MIIELCVRKINSRSNSREIVQSLNGISVIGIPFNSFSDVTKDRFFLAIYSRSRLWAIADNGVDNLQEQSAITLGLTALNTTWAELPSAVKASLNVGIQTLTTRTYRAQTSNDSKAIAKSLASLVHGLSLLKCSASQLPSKTHTALLSCTARYIVFCNQQALAMIVHGLGSIGNGVAVKRQPKLLPSLFAAIESMLKCDNFISELTISGIVGGLGKLHLRLADFSYAEQKILIALVGENKDGWTSKSLAETLRGLASLGYSWAQITSIRPGMLEDIAACLYNSHRNTEDFSSMLNSLAVMNATMDVKGTSGSIELFSSFKSEIDFDSVLLKFMKSTKLSIVSFSFALRGLAKLGLNFKSFSTDLQNEIKNKFTLNITQNLSHRVFILLLLAISEIGICWSDVDKTIRIQVSEVILSQNNEFVVQSICSLFSSLKRMKVQLSSDVLEHLMNIVSNLSKSLSSKSIGVILNAVNFISCNMSMNSKVAIKDLLRNLFSREEYISPSSCVGIINDLTEIEIKNDCLNSIFSADEKLVILMLKLENEINPISFSRSVSTLAKSEIFWNSVSKDVQDRFIKIFCSVVNRVVNSK